MFTTSFVGESRFEGELTTAGSTSFSIALPPGIEENDLVTMDYRSQSQAATAFFSLTGWTHVSESYSLPSSGRRTCGTLIHTVTAEEAEQDRLNPGSVEFTFARPANHGDARVSASLKVWRATPVSVVAITDQDTSTTYGGHTVPAQSDPTFTVANAATEVTTGQSRTPTNASITNWTELPGGVLDDYTSGNGSSTLLRSIYRMGVTSVGSLAMGWPTETAPYSWSVSYRWVPGLNGNPSVEVLRHLEIPNTGYTISEMEADIAAGRPVFWAHRGGSVNGADGSGWGEMTVDGARKAVYRGAKCIEVSFRRSRDGEWIASHDADTSRVTATSLTIADTDSADLLGIPVDTPTASGVIGKLEDFLLEFGHLVLILDNKDIQHSAEAREDFYSRIEDLVPDVYEHVIIKIDGATDGNSATKFAAAQSRGFKVAAYFFHSSTLSWLTNKSANIDYIGLNYDADSQGGNIDWADVLSEANGNPTWAHVLPDFAAYLTAVEEGAKIFQCGNVIDIIPLEVPGANVSSAVGQYQFERERDQREMAETVLAMQDWAVDIFEARRTPAPPFDIPTATWSNDETTSAYTSPAEFLPAVLDGGSQVTGWDGRTSPAQTDFVLHPGVFETVQGVNSDYVLRGAIKPEGDAQFCHWPIIVEFVTDADVATFEVTTYNANAQTPIVVEVGGQYAGTFYNPAGMTSGRKVRFDFIGPSERWIRLYIMGEIGFRAIRVENGKAISVPPNTVTRRIAVIGDSWVHGAGSPVAAGTLRGTSPVDTFVWPLMKAMGGQEFIQAGIGGTGVVAGLNGMDPANYETRVSAVLAMNPDVLIIRCGANDPYDGNSSYGTDEEIYDDMVLAMESLLTATDSVTERYVLTIPREEWTIANQAIRDAVKAHGDTSVRLIELEGLFSGTGNAIDGGTGTRGIFFLDDNSHSTADGHLFLARQCARQILPLMP